MIVLALTMRGGLPVARWSVVALLMISLAVAAAAAEQHGGAAPASNAGEPAAQLYTEEDLLFLTHMIVHHQQALDLAVLVPSRTKRDAFIRFAGYVDGEQRAEIELMNSWLQLARNRGIEVPHHELHGDPPMHGMLSRAQMAALAVANGAEFERLWLQGMIYHHQGALDMAQVQQRRQFESGRRPFGIDVLVDDIIEVQRAEINKMQMWLREWGLVSKP